MSSQDIFTFEGKIPQINEPYKKAIIKLIAANLVSLITPLVNKKCCKRIDNTCANMIVWSTNSPQQNSRNKNKYKYFE